MKDLRLYDRDGNVVTQGALSTLMSELDKNDDELNKLRSEKEMLVYWLIRSYRALNRAEWEEGATLEETSDAVLNVLDFLPSRFRRHCANCLTQIEGGPTPKLCRAQNREEEICLAMKIKLRARRQQRKLGRAYPCGIVPAVDGE